MREQEIQCLEDYIYDTQVEQWIEFLEYNKKYSRKRRHHDTNVNQFYPSTFCALSKFVKLDTILKYPDISWNWYDVSQNPNLTWDFIKEYLDKDLSWYSISIHPNITWDIIQNNLHYPEKPEGHEGRWPTGEIPWKWDNISKNPNITWKIIQANPNYQWKEYYVSVNPNITWEIVQSNPNYPWNWAQISKHPNITWDIIRDNPNYPWDGAWIARNPNITWNIIQNNPQYPWDINQFMFNPNMTLEIIQSNPNIQWRYDYFFNLPNIYKQNIDWNVLKTMTDKPFRWDAASYHSGITWKMIKDTVALDPDKEQDDFKQIPWDWEHVSLNSNITCEIVQNNPEYSWNWDNLAENPNMTWNFIKKNRLKLLLEHKIVLNPFTHQLDLIRQECILKWYAARRIRKWWLFKCYFNPENKVGKRMMEKRYQEMMNDS